MALKVKKKKSEITLFGRFPAGRAGQGNRSVIRCNAAKRRRVISCIQQHKKI